MVYREHDLADSLLALTTHRERVNGISHTYHICFESSLIRRNEDLREAEASSRDQKTLQ